MKFYNITTTSILPYGRESWMLQRKYTSRVNATEIKFLRRLKGCTGRNEIINIDIRNELNKYSINDRIEWKIDDWKGHTERMKEIGIPKKLIKYKHKGNRKEDRGDEKQYSTGTGN